MNSWCIMDRDGRRVGVGESNVQTMFFIYINQRICCVRFFLQYTYRTRECELVVDGSGFSQATDPVYMYDGDKMAFLSRRSSAPTRKS